MMETIERRYILRNTVMDGDCVVWRGTCNKKGRPYIRSRGHRVYVDSYIKFINGWWDFRKEITHTCGNEACINPQHMSVER